MEPDEVLIPASLQLLQGDKIEAQLFRDQLPVHIVDRTVLPSDCLVQIPDLEFAILDMVPPFHIPFSAVLGFHFDPSVKILIERFLRTGL